MVAEEFFSSVCGPPLTSNTAIAKDVGIYAHSLWPTFGAKATFKKSATPPHCLAVSDTHVFAAQHDKAYIHVYSRLRGTQESFVTLPERIRCLALAGNNVLVIGTVEGRILLWETSTGRLVSLPPCHVQAVSCVVAAPYHLLTGSDDSNVHVWNLAQLLDLDAGQEHEPVASLPNHRGAITDLAVSPAANVDTSLCVSASKDKTCVVWNYLSGQVLRTLIFPTAPLCLALDPATRGIFVSTEDGSIYSADFFGPKPLLGPDSEDSSTVVQVTSKFCTVPTESGPASCLALAYDGTVLLSGHPKGQVHVWAITDQHANSGPKELTNLNAAVTNITFVSPLAPSATATKTWTVVKPAQTRRGYNVCAQYEADLTSEMPFAAAVKAQGFPQATLDAAIAAFLQPTAADVDDELSQQQIEDQWTIINGMTALS